MNRSKFKIMERGNIEVSKIKNTFQRNYASVVATAFLVMASSQTAFAAGTIQNSQIVKGTEKLIGDVTTWLMILAPIVAGLLIIYFCVRRSAADEMDQKKWNNRITVAVVSCIGAVLASATLNLILGYYK